jgi:hypothetical protein
VSEYLLAAEADGLSVRKDNADGLALRALHVLPVHLGGHEVTHVEKTKENPI